MTGGDEDFLSLEEAAKKVGISSSRLRRLAANGTLAARKVGFYWVVSARALKVFMALERPRGIKRAARQGPARGKK